MGITPITNLIPLSNSRTVASTLEPLPMARVENSGRTSDETYSPSPGQSSGESEEAPEDSPGEEPSTDQYLNSQLLADESAATAQDSFQLDDSSPASLTTTEGQISFFA